MFILKKRWILTVSGIISIALIGLLAPYKQVDGNPYSVFECIMNLNLIDYISIDSAFSAGTAFFWFYILAPLVAAIPILSHISEVEKSGFSTTEKIRSGRVRYYLQRLWRIIISCFYILFSGLLLYTAFLLPLFWLPDTMANEPDIIFNFIQLFLKKLIYMLGFGVIAAVFSACIIWLYNDLFFVMSITFTVSYIFRNVLFEENIFRIIILLVILALIYILLGKRDGIR